VFPNKKFSEKIKKSVQNQGKGALNSGLEMKAGGPLLTHILKNKWGKRAASFGRGREGGTDRRPKKNAFFSN